MKKIVLYILIFATLAGLFTPKASIHAATGDWCVTSTGFVGTIQNDLLLGGTRCVANQPPSGPTEGSTCRKDGQNGTVRRAPVGSAMECSLVITGGSCTIAGRVGKWSNTGQCIPDTIVPGTSCIVNGRIGVRGANGQCVPVTVACTAPNTPPGCTVVTPPDTTYHLLAPLPCSEGENGCVNGQLTTFDPTSDAQGRNSRLGEYTNLIIKILIGMAAVMAVVMIVVGGIEYITSELISNKAEGKNRILDALLGLVIALGAFALLNTINPDLLRNEVTVVKQQVVGIDRSSSPPEVTRFASSIPTGPVPECPEGVVKTNTPDGIVTCRRIANNIERMIADARNSVPPIILSASGEGFRTREQQTALRIKNCHGDTTSLHPNPPCNPETALPGTSRHESGLALDMTCTENGRTQTIQDRTNACYLWLKANASKYGLQELADGSEAWHWSIDGR